MYPFRLYKRFTIDTSLELEEAVDLLSTWVSQKNFFRTLFWEFTRREWEGKINGRAWNINRVSHFRNILLPRLYGKFVPTERGVCVEVLIMMAPLDIAIAAVIVLCAVVSIHSVQQVINIGCFLMILYLTIYIIFGYEISKAERFIHWLFDVYRVA